MRPGLWAAHGGPFPPGAFCIPLYVPYVLTGRWPFSRGLCKLWLVVDYLLCTSSVFNIVLISYDRFLSVTRAVSVTAGTAQPAVWGRWVGGPAPASTLGPVNPSRRCWQSPGRSAVEFWVSACTRGTGSWPVFFCLGVQTVSGCAPFSAWAVRNLALLPCRDHTTWAMPSCRLPWPQPCVA